MGHTLLCKLTHINKKYSYQLIRVIQLDDAPADTTPDYLKCSSCNTHFSLKDFSSAQQKIILSTLSENERKHLK
jgi:hypothetical protein